MPPRRRSLDTRGRFGRYPPLTKIPRANKSDVAETRGVTRTVNGTGHNEPAEIHPRVEDSETSNGRSRPGGLGVVEA